ncbi:MAG: BatD family protein [Luteimonas sp.]
MRLMIEKPRCSAIAHWWLLWLLLLPLAAQAQTRAWLDRDRIASGETATLNVETDQAMADAPSYAALLGDFALSGNSSSRQFESVNGRAMVRVLFAVALSPKRDGVLSIPALRVGAQATQPLTLTVTPAAAAPVDAHGNDAVYIEAETDAQDPYVQQSVGLVVRLFYATPLISGQFDQPAPDGAALQRIGDDLQYARNINGHRYTVVERRFLLVPERSGTLTIPGATFEGRGAGGFFDQMFGDGQRDMSARGAPRFLHVRAVPAAAPQPWLPLRALSLRYLAAPQNARAGEAATVTVEAMADGATGAQVPELQLQAIDGAQVFAEPAQTDETFDQGRPQAKITRRFSIVPSREGALRIPGLRVAWWDVRAGIARTATLPDIALRVQRGANAAANASAAAIDATPATRDAESWWHVPGVQGDVHPWALGTVVFALLWLATLMWGLQRRSAAHAARAPREMDSGKAASDGNAPTATRTLKQALDTGTLADVGDALLAMAVPSAADLDALRARLDDPAQRAAIDALQRARWADGDGAQARTILRQAFKSGPRWRVADKANASLLPPLYPD